MARRPHIFGPPVPPLPVRDLPLELLLLLLTPVIALPLHDTGSHTHAGASVVSQTEVSLDTKARCFCSTETEGEPKTELSPQRHIHPIPYLLRHDHHTLIVAVVLLLLLVISRLALSASLPFRSPRPTGTSTVCGHPPRLPPTSGRPSQCRPTAPLRRRSLRLATTRGGGQPTRC